MTPSDDPVDAVAGRSADRAAAYANQRRPPSPPWYGALTIGNLGVMALILLTYTLADITWQQELGGWNYVVVIALIPITSVMMRLWQPDENM